LWLIFGSHAPGKRLLPQCQSAVVTELSSGKIQMLIKRRGAERDHGMASTVLKPRTIEWNSATKSIEIAAYWVPDFNTPAKHDWYVSLTPEELARMLEATATAIRSSDADVITEHLRPRLTALLQIATECSLPKDCPPVQAPSPPGSSA
jgi:hypothetical protein